MGASKPSKKQRGKQKKALKAKATAAAAKKAGIGANPLTGLGIQLAPVGNKHVKFGDDGAATKAPAKAPAVSIVSKKRGRAPTPNSASASTTTNGEGKGDAEDEKASGGGKSDCSAEMIQSAKYYLEQWKKRDAPPAEGEEPWKFKKVKQLWILKWMFEADVIPKSMFALVLEYLGGLQGVARQRVLESAHAIIDQGVPNKDDGKAAGEDDLPTRLARRRYKRALQVAELLS